MSSLTPRRWRVLAVTVLLFVLALVAVPAGFMSPTLAAVAGTAPAGHASSLPGTWRVLGAAAALPTLYQPMGLAVGRNGNVYVADSGNFRVVEIGPHGQLVAHFGDADLRPGPKTPAPPAGQSPPLPSSLAVNAHGIVYAADPIHHAARVYSTRHRLTATWPISVSNATVLQLAVAVGAGGNVIVAIAAQVHCTDPHPSQYCASYTVVERRSPAGALLGQFHSAIGPSGLDATPPIISQIAAAVDARGDIYAATDGMLACEHACLTFHYLTKRAPDGRILAQWGTKEIGPGTNWPSVAVGGRGNIFVADNFNHRIDKLASGGAVIAHWSLGTILPTSTQCSETAFVGGCRQPSSVAVDRHGDVYATDPASDHVLKLSPEGRLLAQWGAGGTQPGRFSFPTSLALDPAGQLWVDDANVNTAIGVLTTNRVQALGSNGRFQVQFMAAHAGAGMALDRQGNLYIGQAPPQGLVISKLSPTGTLLARWGGLHLGELPSGIAVAPNGDVLVLGFLGFQDPSQFNWDGTDIERLSPSGRLLGLIHLSFAPTRSGIAVDTEGNSYTAYGTLPHYEKYTPGGALLASWGAPKPLYANAYPSPAGLALDAAGNIYVANTPQDIIEEFNPNGTLVQTWGGSGSNPGQFHQPSGIAVASNGTIYVADTGNHRIQELSR